MFSLSNYLHLYIKMDSDIIFKNEADIYVLTWKCLRDIQLLNKGVKDMCKGFYIDSSCIETVYLFLLRGRYTQNASERMYNGGTLTDGELTCFKLIGIFYFSFVTMCICYFHNTT